MPEIIDFRVTLPPGSWDGPAATERETVRTGDQA